MNDKISLLCASILILKKNNIEPQSLTVIANKQKLTVYPAHFLSISSGLKPYEETNTNPRWGNLNLSYLYKSSYIADLNVFFNTHSSLVKLTLTQKLLLETILETDNNIYD